MKDKKIALLGPTDRSIWTFRKGLISQLIADGHKVTVICSGGSYVEKIKSIGANHIEADMDRFMNPLRDFIYLFSLLKIFRHEKFDILHTFTIKPNFYGAIAAKLAGIRDVYSLVEGLGFLYNENNGIKPFLSRFMLFTIYKLAFFLNKKVWFINQDDPRDLVRRKILPSTKIVFIKSIGVDKDEYSLDQVDKEALSKLRKEYGPNGNELFVTLIGRMNWTKGIREFIEASKITKERYPNVIYLLVGEIQEGSPYSISKKYLKNNEDENFKWLDFRSDIVELLTLTDIFVLPTFYREGVPRSILEAMSLGKPVIATDSVGCREIVEDGINGILIPTRDAKALADSIVRLFENPELRKKYGKVARERIERELDERIIVRRVINELYELN